ncbi:hypothetical protein F900_02756 [Acinetobacter modestus]|uniref:Uncharacterized protein n=1 Tax=Acinetobacter modestus TaxID=1776740 RepID=N9LR37_9GAMM|nr:hypothetical protein [Acinetobacter modestus]ENW98673.1 hypothetical protein F900_02756 [Acinetobacter modestus]
MNEIYINIIILGLDIKTTLELKSELRRIIPRQIHLNWIYTLDENIDLIIVGDSIFDTHTIQRFIKQKKIKYLKISEKQNITTIENSDISISIHQSAILKNWIQYYVINNLSHQIPTNINNSSPEKNSIDLKYLNDIFKFKNTKLHLSDDNGSLAIIDTGRRLAFFDPQQLSRKTNQSFNYEIATNSDLLKNNFTSEANLEDWIWNLFWRSPEFSKLTLKENEYYKIFYWPQPNQNKDQKIILQLSACFIQGAQLSKVANELNLPIKTVQQFISACLISMNGKKILELESNYKKNEILKENSNRSFLTNFFNKIRNHLKI